MNIFSFIEKAEASVQEHSMMKILDRRRQRFHEYCSIELNQGGIDVSASLSSPKGQENVRVLFSRTIEELFEAFYSESEEHYLEELIDALNFGSSILFLDADDDIVLRRMVHVASHVEALDEVTISLTKLWTPQMIVFNVGKSFSPLLESLRNRAWQKQTQQPYFTGEVQLRTAAVDLFSWIVPQFGNWKKFYSYFIAKDEVLRFRLASGY